MYRWAMITAIKRDLKHCEGRDKPCFECQSRAEEWTDDTGGLRRWLGGDKVAGLRVWYGGRAVEVK